MMIPQGDLRAGRRFSRDDADVVTLLSVVPALQVMGETDVAATYLVGRAVEPTAKSEIQRFGYRFQEFTSQYDSPVNRAAIAARFPVLWKLHNENWRGSITVKGDPRYRVGLRVGLDFPFCAHLDLQPNPGSFIGWYVEGVDHSMTWGGDYTTKLSLRFNQKHVPTIRGPLP
jgi:hypothetical protein